MPSGNRLVGLSDEPSRRAGLSQYDPIRAEQYCNSACEGGYSCIVVHPLSPFMKALQEYLAPVLREDKVNNEFIRCSA